MRVLTLPRVLAGAVAVLSVAAPLGPAAAAPASSDLSSEAAYSCQYAGLESQIRTPSGLPIPSLAFDLPSLGGRDVVTVSTTVDAPEKVVPGESVTLSGETRFAFGPNATVTSLSTAFTFLSDDFGVEVTLDDATRLVRVAELETTRSTATSPVVTARWTLPALEVPTSATGQLRLALPQEDIVTNPVTTSPESVAFTGSLQSDSPFLQDRAVACALVEGEDASIGTVSVATASSPDDGGDAGSLPPVAEAGVVPADLSAPLDAESPDATVAAATPISLAADPIPPATVPDGIRLPAWALLLLYVVVATGLVLAVTSYRRLRQVTTAAVLALLLLVPTRLNPVSAPLAAEAATSRAQVTLTCVYNDRTAAADARARNQPTGLSIALNVPTSVSPGEVITLSGSATVQAPEDIRSQAAQLGFSTLDAISDTLSVGLTVGSGQRRVFAADRWQTGKTKFGNPLVVSAPLSFPSFKVPANARGSIAIDLPRNEVLNRRPAPHSNPNTPARTALEFVATVSGNGARATYLVACWRSDSGAGRIATIPVRAASAGGGTGTTPGGSAVPGAAAPADLGADAPPGSGAEAATVAAGGPAPELAAGASARSVGSVSDDIAVPPWLLVVLGVLGVAGYGITVRNQLRLRADGSR